MANRMHEGFKLYKKGHVKIELFDDDLMIFNVESSKKGNYQVSMNENVWLCDCDDYQYRGDKEVGSFICKHIWAVLFKIMDMKSES